MNNGCDLVTLPPFSKQVLASLTKKLRKENTILKTITFSWPKWICLWCCLVLWSFWNQTAVECSFLICCGMLTSTLPILLVLKPRLFIWDLYSSVSPLCFICKSREHAFSTLLQIIDAPYWILRRLRYGDPVKPRNCILSWHSWFPPHFPCFRGNSTLSVMDAFTISWVCVLKPSKATAGSASPTPLSPLPALPWWTWGWKKYLCVSGKQLHGHFLNTLVL